MILQVPLDSHESTFSHVNVPETPYDCHANRHVQERDLGRTCCSAFFSNDANFQQQKRQYGCFKNYFHPFPSKIASDHLSNWNQFSISLPSTVELYLSTKLLLMEEILHQLIWTNIPLFVWFHAGWGGAGFLPSTVGSSRRFAIQDTSPLVPPQQKNRP